MESVTSHGTRVSESILGAGPITHGTSPFCADFSQFGEVNVLVKVLHVQVIITKATMASVPWAGGFSERVLLEATRDLSHSYTYPQVRIPYCPLRSIPNVSFGSPEPPSIFKWSR